MAGFLDPGMLAALGLGSGQPNQTFNTALGLSVASPSTGITPGQANPNAPGGAYSGATISRPSWQMPEWLSTAGQVAMLPHQALYGVTQPLYRTMFSGAPFDVNTVATQHPWLAQHLPAFVGLDVQTGQPRPDVQFMQRYVADPLALVGTTALESELLPRMLPSKPPVSTVPRSNTLDALDAMIRLGRRFVTAQAVTQQQRQSPQGGGG